MVRKADPAVMTDCAHSRERWLSNASGSFRKMASTTASTCSAMVSALRPRELVITTGDCDHRGEEHAAEPCCRAVNPFHARRRFENVPPHLRREDDLGLANHLQRFVFGSSVQERVVRKLLAKRVDVFVAGMFQAGNRL